MDSSNHSHLSQHWEALTEELMRRRLLIDPAAVTYERLQWMVRLRAAWSRFGWQESADYHVLSFDYPCVDYSEGSGFLTDQDRMRAYQAREADTDRFKLDYLDRPEIKLAGPTAELPSRSAREVWCEPLRPVPIHGDALSTVISLSFGATGTVIPRTGSAPLLRRSSPSGGARNPSEGYVVVRDVPGLPRGWYHVTMRPFGLRLLEGPPMDDEGLLRLFPETIERFPLDAKALIVITSVFERNMYRYREPRTFRTVHMDAGHIASAVRISARSQGLSVGTYYCDMATKIEDALDIDGLREGYMLTIALADGVDEASGAASPT